jgi:hypothetical protein
VLVDERGNIVADVENEPDRDETGDAIKIHLQEIANHVSVEKFHQKNSNFGFRISILG